jgi:hypothetical protein
LIVVVIIGSPTELLFFVIPGLPKAEPDCVGRIANANAAGGAKRERHGWRESIGVVMHVGPQTDSGFGPRIKSGAGSAASSGMTTALSELRC